MSIITGYSVDYIKKFTACFSRARYVPYPGFGEEQNPEKEVQYSEKSTPLEKGAKRRKSLTVNFSAPIGGCHTPKGVTFRRGKGFQAQIRVGKKVKYLGIFKTAAAAEGAYNNAVNTF